MASLQWVQSIWFHCFHFITWCHFRILAAWGPVKSLAKKQTLAMPICSCGSRKPSANPSTRWKGIYYTKANKSSFAAGVEHQHRQAAKRKKSARIQQQTCFCQSMLRWIFFDTKTWSKPMPTSLRPSHTKLQLPSRNQLGSPYCAESQHQSSGFDAWRWMDEGVPLSICIYIYTIICIYIYIMHDKNSFRIYSKLHPFGKCIILQDICYCFGII